MLSSGTALADGWTPIVAPGQTPYKTNASLTNSIANTRHNFAMTYLRGVDGKSLPSGAGVGMIAAEIGVKNNYGEICVYCHTPHGANTKLKAPIWNRTINTGQYKIYDKLRTLNRPIGQPGPNSLTCLSCHDGTIANDSIINMPGSGRYNSSQETVVDKAWLSTWPQPGAAAAGIVVQHYELGDPASDFARSDFSAEPAPTITTTGKCTQCHSTDDTNIPDFRVFVIGTDLRNDHPIGILFPDQFGPGTGVDFNKPTGEVIGKLKFFDRNGNGHSDTNEPRLYDTGEGAKVECASCHDPHGIPTNGVGSQFIPSFLRVSNGNVNTGYGNSSGLCLTCHEK